MAAILDGVQTYHIYLRMGTTQGPLLLSLMHLASMVSEMKMLKVSRQTDAGWLTLYDDKSSPSLSSIELIMVVGWFMVFNATFNNITAISWQSVLLVEEAGVPGENHRPAASHWQTLSHNVVSNTPCHEKGFKLTTLEVIGTDCTGSYKSNYHTNTSANNGLFTLSV